MHEADDMHGESCCQKPKKQLTVTVVALCHTCRHYVIQGQTSTLLNLENPSRWHQKWPFTNLVASETSISESGEIGNGDIERMTPQGLRGDFDLPTKISKCSLKVLLKSYKLLC